MDERGQLVPLNLCSPSYLMRELKSLNNGFLPPPPPLSPTPSSLASSRFGRLAATASVSDLEVPFISRVTGGFCSPSGRTSILLPDYRLQQKSQEDEPKPNFSYIGLIAKAILSSKERRMVLSEIYEWIQVNYTYFRSRGPGWRNSIRHNLSLNDCFIKVGRSSNGKGHYWGIHPANVEDFRRGDFRRRRAQRKVRRALGLSCPGDGEDSDSPPLSPPPPHFTPTTSLPLPLFPLRASDNTGGGSGGGVGSEKGIFPPPPPINVFAALLNSLTTAGLLPLPPLPPLPPLQEASPTPLRLQSLQREGETSSDPLNKVPSPSGSSFSVASLLGSTALNGSDSPILEVSSLTSSSSTSLRPILK
ncbi:Forkhead box protein I1 [Echinococcus granulosus]|uniref:Forkhead box protein I1 n=1 Tax=Echinococcus granulosus TaxID=6210 RepID=W6U524_ECHGR|nr:Forkhead box protein I1 [Echinococcus granulosus]EUB56225.1 Forkhead box protein I1 [Echinococcus granulosus]